MKNSNNSNEEMYLSMGLGCNHPMGPLHLGDLIGWDIVLNIMDVLYNRPCRRQPQRP